MRKPGRESMGYAMCAIALCWGIAGCIGTPPEARPVKTVRLLVSDQGLRYRTPSLFAVGDMVICRYILDNPPNGSKLIVIDAVTGRRLSDATIPFDARLQVVDRTRVAVCPIANEDNLRRADRGYLLTLPDVETPVGRVRLRPSCPIGMSGAYYVTCDLTGDEGLYFYDLATGKETVLTGMQHGVADMGAICLPGRLVLSGRKLGAAGEWGAPVTQLWSIAPLKKLQEYPSLEEALPHAGNTEAVGPDAFAFQVGVTQWQVADARTGRVLYSLGKQMGTGAWWAGRGVGLGSVTPDVVGGREYVRDTGRLLMVQKPLNSRDVLLLAYDAKTGRQLQQRSFPRKEWNGVSIGSAAGTWTAMVHLAGKQVVVRVDDLQKSTCTLRVPSLHIGEGAHVFTGSHFLQVRQDLQARFYSVPPPERR